MKISKMRWIRLMNGQTIDSLSASIGLDRGLLSRAERGLYRLTTEQKAKIAAAFHASIDDLFNDDEDAKR